MFDTGSKDEHITDPQRIVAAERRERYLALEQMYGDVRIRTVHRQHALSGDAHDSQAEWSFLDERTRGAAVPGEELGVEHPLVLRQMVNKHFAGQNAIQ